MTNKKMTRQEEHDFHADPENQTPQGPARRRNSKLTELVPVRFPPDSSPRSATQPTLMTDRCRRGFAARSTTNSNTTPRPPDLDARGSRCGRRTHNLGRWPSTDVPYLSG